jgi:DNA-binding NtrC family response regulator
MAVLGHLTLHAPHAAPDRRRQGSVLLFKKVLLVEPDRHAMAALEQTWSLVSFVECCRDFQTARQRLLAYEPNLLVTNLHLKAFNGLHLVYLAATSGPRTRCVAYANLHNPSLARETQSAGAFTNACRVFRSSRDAMHFRRFPDRPP